MTDGGTCARITLSNFIEEFVAPKPGSLALRLTRAAAKANLAVFDRYKERGGSTLSAIAIDATGLAVGLNVGDSRIYASTASGFIPLTVDDTLSAAFGAEGNGLIQFIGIGQGLRSHMIEVPHSTHTLFLTSDGAHFPDAKTFGELMTRSPNPKAAVERGLALARWLGSPDNASMVAIDVSQTRSSLSQSSSRLFAILGLPGSVQVLESPSLSHWQTDPEPPPLERLAPPPKKRARSRKQKQEKPVGQLQIEIDPVRTDTDDNSE